MLEGADIVSAADYTREELEYIFNAAEDFEPVASGKYELSNLTNRTLSLCFYQPSTRTRMSFETAMKKLGGITVGMTSPVGTSAEKGESLKDTVRVLAGYSDIMVIRHPEKGIPRMVSETVDIPVINGGDDASQHPTQALIDLYSIRKEKGDIDGLCVAAFGDIPRSRTIKSLAYALSNYDVKFYFAAPEKYQVPNDVRVDLENRDFDFEMITELHEEIGEVDILYSEFRSAYEESEKYESEKEKQKLRETLFVTQDLLDKAKDSMKVMHPLPRTEELPTEVDGTPYELYFQQSDNGIPVRCALLSILLDRYEGYLK